MTISRAAGLLINRRARSRACMRGHIHPALFRPANGEGPNSRHGGDRGRRSISENNAWAAYCDLELSASRKQCKMPS